MTDRLISCDDHMDLSQLPADLWTTRLPAALLDGAPRVEEQDGQAVWVCDGKVWAAGMASRRRRVRRGRSRRSTMRSTAEASTTRARAVRPSPSCVWPTWTATAWRRR